MVLRFEAQWSPICLFLPLLPVLLVSCPRNRCQTQCHEACPPCLHMAFQQESIYLRLSLGKLEARVMLILHTDLTEGTACFLKVTIWQLSYEDDLLPLLSTLNKY